MRFSAFLLLALFSPALAQAQSPAATRIRGDVTAVQGADITVKPTDGASVTVHLNDNYQVAAITKGSMADIKTGTFIGAGARPQPDGSLQAVQIVIFPEAMRGTGEGHRAWGVLPEATMTNATVAEAVTGVAGPILTLKYKDGEKKLAISGDATILTLIPATKAELVTGAQIQLFATKSAEGALQAGRVTILRDGVNPM